MREAQLCARSQTEASRCNAHKQRVVEIAASLHAWGRACLHTNELARCCGMKLTRNCSPQTSSLLQASCSKPAAGHSKGRRDTVTLISAALLIIRRLSHSCTLLCANHIGGPHHANSHNCACSNHQSLDQTCLPMQSATGHILGSAASRCSEAHFAFFAFG